MLADRNVKQQEEENQMETDGEDEDSNTMTELKQEFSELLG